MLPYLHFDLNCSLTLSRVSLYKAVSFIGILEEPSPTGIMPYYPPRVCGNGFGVMARWAVCVAVMSSFSVVLPTLTTSVCRNVSFHHGLAGWEGGGGTDDAMMMMMSCERGSIDIWRLNYEGNNLENQRRPGQKSTLCLRALLSGHDAHVASFAVTCFILEKS